MATDLAAPRHPLIDLAEIADFQLGEVRVRPALLTISSAGRQRELQPRVMQVLVALAEARPEVVSRDKLVARCWNGRIVGDDALNRCIVHLRTVAREFGDKFVIENVARVGYRLVVADAVIDPVRPARRRRGAPILAAVLVLGLTAFLVVRAMEPARRAASPNRVAEVQRLLQTGEAMLRTGNPQVAGEARVAFDQALAIDSRLAPAWVGRAEALRSEASVRGPEAVIAILPKVRADIARALNLDPRLAAAHALLGNVLGVTPPAAQRELRLAATLAPGSPEAQIGLAAVRRASGDFAGELAAYRKASELDSTWYRPVRDLAIATAEMGDRAEALRIAGTIKQKQPLSGCAGPPARIAWIYGDIAESARCSAASVDVDSIWQAPARVRLAAARTTLGLSRDWKAAAPIHILDVRPPQGRVWLAAAPTPATWQEHNRSPDAALAYRMENRVAAKLMLNAGRHAELAATYSGPHGLLGLRRGHPIQVSDFPAVPLVSLALQKAGRGEEAEALLRTADRIADGAMERGPVPFTFEAEAAAVAAVQGDGNRAIALLHRARVRGWVNNDWSDLPNLADEPAFAGLKRDPRFRAICAGLDTLYARERRKMIAAGL